MHLCEILEAENNKTVMFFLLPLFISGASKDVFFVNRGGAGVRQSTVNLSLASAGLGTGMSSPATGPALVERADIHKSCKSIEALLNILNEYCEAAGAVVALQKKLAKALRETAGLKVTGEIAANAMHASATIFESLSDIDAKFSKVADKEYDIVSAEVKKWFKKLAKEEKTHDERMANANAKIKQAGQAFEKKSKKKTVDASEEHAKYINLISTLGPEVSQEKYVAACLSRLADTEWQKSCECVRRFSPTIGPLGQWRALCEGGWTGQIPPDLPDLDASNGQPTPQTENEPIGLKPIEEEVRQPPRPQATTPRLTPEPGERLEQPRARVPPPGYSTGPPSAAESSNDLSRDQISARNSPTLTRQHLPPTATVGPSEVAPAVTPSTNLEPPKPGFVDANTGSVRSLSAFPTPPTHFPLPPPRQPQSQQSSYFQSNSSSSNLDFPSTRQLAESPISDNDHPGGGDLEVSSSRAAVQNFRDVPPAAAVPSLPSPELRYRERQRMSEEQSSPSAPEISRPTPVRAQTSLPPESTYQSSPVVERREARHGPSSSIDTKPLNSRAYGREDYEPDSQEFGAFNRNTEVASKSRMVESSKYPRALERMDTGTSSGSIVAAMRDRYSSNPGSTSPPPRDLPRLPLSVNDLATRYQPSDTPLSPRARAISPPVARQQSLPLLETAARQAQESYLDRIPNPDEDARRRQRYDELGLVEQEAREKHLRERERELEMLGRELERDRVRLHTLREDEKSGEQEEYREGSTQPGQFGLRPRERRTSLRHQLQRPLSQMDLDEVGDRSTRVPGGSPSAISNLPPRQPQYSYNAGHLVPPSTPGINTSQPLHSPKPGQHSLPPSPQSPAEAQYESRIRERYAADNASNSNTNSTSGSTHAAYCGCETCSVNKYRNPGTSSNAEQPLQSKYQQAPADAIKAQNLRSEKPSKGGWIRRLSMPVGNAFSSDSKRHQSNNSISSTNNYGLGSGVGSTPASGSRGLFSLDGKRNSSTTALLSSGTSNGDRGLTVQEDGRLRQGGGMGRRSFEASGSSNRSMTNLGVTGRR
ncbi:hypothetical protein GALMADRAFT_279447 [Galerina marginata CBS 339.88]|uniref:IMD domain-containing protein n=1 Tax=Galerina marginata (strain CBS 339.88) TaxID=685588 RepID=A0A067SZH6_GALM3|nr:hypothetical protein GALMADRAFT_279447 [Galerina marginata CBS 339.88]